MAELSPDHIRKAFFESHPDPMMIFDRESLAILDVNDAAVDHYGYSREEFLSMVVGDLHPPKNLSVMAKTIAALQTGRNNIGNWQHSKKSGEIITVSITNHLIDFQGSQAALATIRDITHVVALETERDELHRREQKLRRQAEASAHHFQSMFEAVPGKFLVLRPEDFEILAVSDAYLDATMACREDIKGRPMLDVLPVNPEDPDSDSRSRLEASLHQVRSSGLTDVMAVQRSHFPVPEHLGGGFEERFWSCVNTPVKGPEGELAFIIHQAEDVTEFVRGALEDQQDSDAALKEIEARDTHMQLDILLRSRELKAVNSALQEQEANWRTAQRLLGIGTWKLDLQTGYLTRTENIYEMYRISEESFGHSFEDYLQLVHPDDRESFSAEFAAFDIRPGAVFDFTHRIVRGDNSIIHIRGIGEVTETYKGPIITGVVQDITPQMETEARLAAADDLLLLANQAARLGAWQVDLIQNQVIWTEETAAIHELPGARTMPTDQAMDYYAPESVGRIREVFGKCVEDGTPFDEVLELITAKGRRISVRSIGKAVRDENGRIVSVRGAFQDVSELVRARQNLETLSRRLLDTFEGMSDGFYLLDSDFRFTYMNREAERLLERRNDELFGKYIWDEFPLLKDTLVRERYEEAVRSGNSVDFYLHSPDFSVWYRIKAHPGSDGLAVYFQDVSQEHDNQEQLRLSEERFQLIARATVDVVWDWDLLKDSIWWNVSLEEVFGFDSRDVPASSQWWAEQVHPEDRERVLQSIQAVFDSPGNNWQQEYRFMHADGHAVTVVDRGFVIRDENGKAVRMIGSMLDITERMEMEDRLRQSQKLEAIGQLTGGVAHDFNNLLTVILGNAELLNEQLDDFPRLRPLAEMTAKAAERGAELTNRLLAFARRQALDPKVIDINELVSGMDGLLRRTLTGNIEIKVEQGQDLWLAEIDPGQLEVAILNLAINARDAMPEGGRLTIETANAELDEIYGRENDEVAPGQYILVSVSDSGSGMPNDIVDRAFDPFFTTKDVGKGSGLGLSMVYGFAKQSRGHAKIYSEPGEGTCVKLYMPRAGQDCTAETIALETPESVGGNESILVVEDDALVRDNLVAQLRQLGYCVISTDGSHGALEVLAQETKIDLLFTDVVMPGINGRQLAERARELRPQLKILFTSGYTENAIVHHGRLDPGVNLLSKPYRRQEMAAKVRAVLDESPASDSANNKP